MGRQELEEEASGSDEVQVVLVEEAPVSVDSAEAVSVEEAEAVVGKNFIYISFTFFILCP